MTPHYARRPSYKELNKKINAARQALENNGFLPADYQKLAANFRDLNLFTSEEQHQALRAALHEATPDDYDGGRPPVKSYEPATLGRDLFAFAWESEYFEQCMYLKYCLVAGPDEENTLYVFSLHECWRKGRKK
ncbi:MAG: hypothetical protein ACRD4O_07465 [Bryobacteraceae bacterium]